MNTYNVVCTIRPAPRKEIKSISPPVDLSNNAPNGKKCYSCDGKSCSNTVSCSGSEDRCFNATGENLEKEEGSLSYITPVANLTLTLTVFFFNHFFSKFGRSANGC